MGLRHPVVTAQVYTGFFNFCKLSSRPSVEKIYQHCDVIVVFQGTDFFDENVFRKKNDFRASLECLQRMCVNVVTSYPSGQRLF